MLVPAPVVAFLLAVGLALPALAQTAPPPPAPAPPPAPVVPCEPPGGFAAFLDAFRRHAASQGVSAATIDRAFAGLTLDPRVIGYDRAQRRTFRQDFEQFYARRAPAGVVRRGADLARRHAALLQRIEQQFGVPGPVLLAIWGLETGFGNDSGNQPVIRGVATLAYDCRRPGLFQAEFLAALRILERGDLTLEEMRGAFHGELGQTQFLPSSYFRYAVDFDGNGKRDLRRSVADVLASTANFLRGHGWRRGADWSEGAPNFAIFAHWNRSSIYQRTMARLATEIAEAQGGR